MEKKSISKVPFRLNHISTEQFATIKSAFSEEGGKIGLSTSMSFGVNPTAKSIAAISKFEFDQNKNVFLLIEVACHFEIEDTAWNAMLEESGERLVLPEGLAMHFAVLTVGTARGVLHAKTEKTTFNQFVLPTVNLSGVIKDNIVLDLKEE